MKHQEFDLFDFHNLCEGNIKISYKGPWDKHNLLSIGNYIRNASKEDELLNRKVFQIFVELAENVSLYSREYDQPENNKRAGIGSLVIREDNESFYFYSGNVVDTADIIPIIDKCGVINALDHDKLRAFKRRQRNLPHSERGGANIGLIQVALIAGNPLDIKVTPIDNETSFFSVSVQIIKEKFRGKSSEA